MQTLISQFLLVALITFMQPSGVFERLGRLITDAQVKELSTYFENTIEITLINKEGLYSKSQAEIVLKEFFKNNPPQSFQVTHKGTSNEHVHYAIGMLTTKNNTKFRTYFFLKEKQGIYYLQELRFEAN